MSQNGEVLKLGKKPAMSALLIYIFHFKTHVFNTVRFKGTASIMREITPLL